MLVASSQRGSIFNSIVLVSRFVSEILPMAQDQVIDAPTERGKKLIIADIHRAQDGEVTARQPIW
jgi:hypothetical protein